jgi:hypothetical protein
VVLLDPLHRAAQGADPVLDLGGRQQHVGVEDVQGSDVCEIDRCGRRRGDEVVDQSDIPPVGRDGSINLGVEDADMELVRGLHRPAATTLIA